MSRAFAESDALLASVSSALTDETMYPRLVAAVRVHNAGCTDELRQIGSAIVSDPRHFSPFKLLISKTIKSKN